MATARRLLPLDAPHPIEIAARVVLITGEWRECEREIRDALEPAFRLLLETAHDDAHECRRRAPHLGSRIDADLETQRRERLRIERAMPLDDLVQHDTERPHVRPRVDGAR